MGTKIAVMGAGNGGFASASQLALQGHEVYLYELPDFADNIKELKENPVITVTGALLQGEARLAGVSTDPSENFADCEVVLVTAQTVGHLPIARMIGPYVQENQGIFLEPGNCTSIPFRQELNKFSNNGIVAECLTLPYATRKTSKSSVNITRSTGRMGVAAFPSKDTEQALKIYQKAYPDSFAMDNVLEVALCNANILLHPIPTLMSLSRIEYAQGEYYVYREAYTPSVEKLIAGLDAEIAAILRKLDFPAPSCKAMFEKRYGGKWDDMRTWFKDIGSKGPFSSTDRYISEDVPAGITLIASIGRKFGVPTPIADSVIVFTNTINGVDYRESGRSLEELGLGEMDLDSLKKFLSTAN